MKMLTGLTTGMSVGMNMTFNFSEINKMPYRLFQFYVDTITENQESILNPKQQK